MQGQSRSGGYQPLRRPWPRAHCSCVVEISLAEADSSSGSSFFYFIVLTGPEGANLTSSGLGIFID